jgi:transcriptional regulator with AAA-type ATPase domain
MHQKGKLDARLVAVLVDPDARLRLVLCARSLDKAEASFPAAVINDAKKIKIPPLRERAAEIPELMDQWFIGRRSQLRFHALREELRATLQTHAWPENLAELREAVDNLAKLAHYRSGRQAERESQLTRGELRGWTRRLKLKLTFPLLSDKNND